ncbi:MAG: hypothetical protein JSU84_01610 [Thiotrichales bacterium]|nr:MAG: hypothetical protein JSU84_01610 [Thiotrichales bacterium]
MAKKPSLRLWFSCLSCSIGLLLLNGCSAPQKASSVSYGKNVQITPSNPLRRGAHENLCEIFRDNPVWYRDALQSQRRWGTPVAVKFAFIYQESRFVANASPKTSTTIFSNKTSSAFGYAQALDGTWGDYVKSTGNYQAHRSNMNDALDFIGWYNNNANKRIGLQGNQVRELYLAYHEGITGYSMGTYNNKTWLLTVADQVQDRAIRYDQQLRSCNNEIIALLKSNGHLL